ncbi:hypothetical protein H257_14497 [Aphanomyces astaci]|uniref:DDE Tnp4 domain-containing protein n=1 Tax=Aphanomyces astaci TaxID=112090 RepID=W4FTA8_APHAT|nr:hypothetical protein H257_14497 [Aphanomyces astaci]ETV69898.1 hypothetical protein H257_14497 [Aphanomyces astaci]|eukprot:XP_009840636.1 hypothetical protein H257_14497 [Aphanomyces astaci]
MPSCNRKLALNWLKWAKRKRLSPTQTIAPLEYVLGIAIERPLIPDVRLDLNMRDVDARLSFRFDMRDVLQLTTLLGVPNVVVTSSFDRLLGVEAMCVMLRRLRYPTTYYDKVATFGRSREQLCRVFNFMVTFVHAEWKEIIYCNTRIVRHRIGQYAAAIHAKGSPLTSVWAFPDGTKIETCRISVTAHGAVGLNLQKRIYSGHKRKHCLNFQGLTTPDGLCIHLFGPLEG